MIFCCCFVWLDTIWYFQIIHPQMPTYHRYEDGIVLSCFNSYNEDRIVLLYSWSWVNACVRLTMSLRKLNLLAKPSKYINCIRILSVSVCGIKEITLRTDTMMTSSNGNVFRVTGPLCWKFTGPWWIPRTKASDAELWCLLWSAPE